MATGFSDLFAPSLHQPPPGRPQGQLFSQAYTEIVGRIARLELAPGDTFAESALAARLQLSKTPVREALIVLREMGLVEAQAGSGYTVRPIDDIPALWRCEAMVKREAAARIGTSPPASPGTGFVGSPAPLAAALETALADFTESSISAYVVTVLLTRMLFVAAACDPYLVRIAWQLHANLERSLRLALRAAAELDRRPPPLSEGALVVAAMQGDGETVRQLLPTHSDVGAWVVETLHLSDTT
jgi:DNA-binding GntR family transcriptional regulator